MIPISILQILDSRGNPTLAATAKVGQSTLRVAVPSGASTGEHEAVELRDGGQAWGGKGVSKAVDNARMLAEQLTWEPADLSAADERMLQADGTPNKGKLGANALLCMSMLQAVVQAHQARQEPWQLLSTLSHSTPGLPLPFANIINGGRHADNSLQLQEFMIVPVHASSFAQAAQHVAEVTHALKGIIAEKYGGGQTGVGDEGGFAPNVNNPEQVCQLLVEAMNAAGHKVAIAIDAAASEFFSDGAYEYTVGEKLSADALLTKYVELIKQFPIVSLEDPFQENDFESYAKLRQALTQENLACQIVGDDLTVTNPQRVQQAIDAGACDSLLLKINQIGTVTESLQAAALAKQAGWTVMVSHRSGETTDTFIADLAVGLGSGQIKLGAPVRGERTAKYNRLLAIEQASGLPLLKTVKTDSRVQ